MRAFLLLTTVVAAGVLTPAHRAGASSPGILSAKSIAQRVARVYGESHPHTIHEERTTTDSTPHQPMYVLGISGRFHKGHRQARYLYFSALIRRWYVWGITGLDAHRHLVWHDIVLPHSVAAVDTRSRALV